MSWLRRLGRGTVTTARVVATVSVMPLFLAAAMVQSFRTRNDGDSDPDGEEAEKAKPA